MIDQTKLKNFNGLDYDPQLRYGVLHFFEGKYSGKNDRVEVLGAFFDDLEIAEAFKKSIEDESNKSNEKRINEYFKTQRKFYEGDFILTRNRAFISLSCNNKTDFALFVLQTPSKFKYQKYIGGISTVNSTSHGAHQFPSIQKAIISRYKIPNCNEEIAQHLKLNDTKISIGEDLNELILWLKELYNIGESNNQSLSFISEKEKLGWFRNRLESYINNLIQNTSCSFSIIDSEDDQRCYKLIKINAQLY